MHPDDAALIKAFHSEKELKEPYATSLRAIGCDELVDDWTLCLTLLWIAADNLATVGAVHATMAQTIGIASGRVNRYIENLRDASYLGVDRNDGLALTRKGWLAAEILRGARRTS